MVRVAAATYPAGVPESWSAWEDAVEGWVADAQADLLVFPEYGAMELAHLTRAEGLSDQMAAVSDALPRAWDHWATLAQRYGAHILAPSGPVREPQGYVNRAMFFAPNGKRQAHDKQVMTPWERDPMDMRPGAAPVLMETSLGRIGVQIVDHQPGPFRGQFESDFAANAPARARDQRHAPVEFSSHIDSSRKALSGFFIKRGDAGPAEAQIVLKRQTCAINLARICLAAKLLNELGTLR